MQTTPPEARVGGLRLTQHSTRRNVTQIAKAGGMHNALLRWAADFGPVCKFFLGRHTVVVINGASCHILHHSCQGEAHAILA